MEGISKQKEWLKHMIERHEEMLFHTKIEELFLSRQVIFDKSFERALGATQTKLRGLEVFLTFLKEKAEEMEKMNKPIPLTSKLKKA